MGLDIYFHKTKANVENVTEKNYDKVYEQTEAASRKEMEKTYKQCIADLKAASADDYAKVSEACLKTLAKYFSYPQFSGLDSLGYPKNDGEEFTAVPVETWEQNMKSIAAGYYDKEIAYFRKVNFIFEYFRHKMIDQVFAVVTKEDVLDLIDKCNKVLADHNTATSMELLPTTSGFFFGSTEYDQWYYEDVKDVLFEMQNNVLPVFDQGYNVFVDFSW